MAEEAQEARRKRLRSLRQEAEAAQQVEAEAPASDSAADGPVLRFRNYTPRDDELQHQKVEAAKPAPLPAGAAGREPAKDITADPLLNIAPKKANWDLKRDIEKDMAKLDRQTELAIVELLRRKIASAEGGGGGSEDQGGSEADLAAAVREQERAEAKQDVDDDE